MSNIGLTRSFSKGLPQAGPGEVILKIVKEAERLFNMQSLSYSVISDYLRKSLRDSTGASWIEIFFKQDSQLCLLKSLQSVKSIPIDENSLPGLTAMESEPQVINNASASVFYNNFKIQFHPIVLPSKETIQASTVACVPIAIAGEIQLVILLFNKLDENNSLAYFTDNDLYLIEALGLLAANNMLVQQHCIHLQKQLNTVKEQKEEGFKLINLGIESIHRRSSLLNCIQFIQNENRLTKNSIHQISQVMICEGVLFHLYTSQTLKPVIAFGMETYDSKLLCTKTSEYATLSSKDILNINDLSSEPLWDQERMSKMNSLLSCPLIKNDGEIIGCIEFFRKSDPFGPVDENYAKALVEVLVGIPSANLAPHERNSIEKGLGLLFKEMNLFSLSTEEMYDYPKIFAKVRESVRNLVLADSCVFYIADQISNIFWTRQSENCDALSQPIITESLYGHVYSTQTRVTLPSAIPVADIASYDKFGIVQPVISALSLYPVIGLIAVFRAQKPFTAEELDILEGLSKSVAGVLESLWMYKQQNQIQMIKDEPIQGLEGSPEIRFRAVNTKKSLPSSIQYLSLDGDAIVKPLSSLTPPRTSSLYSLSQISQSRIGELKSMFSEMSTKPASTLVILSKRLRQLVPCQYSKLFIMDQNEKSLIDVQNNSFYDQSGLINLCIKSMRHVCIKSAAAEHSQFDRYIDCLGGDNQIDSFLAVPIIVQGRSLGAIAFANASINFGPEDIAIAEFISTIPKEYLADNNESIKDLNGAIQLGRRHKMLQQWCKQVFFVANATQNRIALVKDILNKLYEEKSLEKLLKAGLEMLCAVINSEQAAVIIHENGEFMEYLLKKTKLIKKSHLEDEGLLLKAIEIMRPISLESQYGKENIIVVPYSEKNMPMIVIKAINKRDDTLSFYSNFNKEDEQTIYEFAINVSRSMAANGRGEAPDNLKQYIRQCASSLNTHSIISTIRTASQKLLDCDRATVFIIEEKEMVVKAQGMEKEIPGGFRVPIGKGIIGNVAQTGQTENIRDVYNDPRFDPEMDKKTGYRTSTMLCMPVLDTNGKVIAALQMINKKRGYFDESDEETLVIFSEIISSALQNCSLFMHTMSERTKILNILNSIGNYILVFNSEGILDYSNKSIKSIFGVSKKQASKGHYSSWLRENRKLVLDITSVFQNSSNKVNRKSQKLVKSNVKRARTLTMTRGLQANEKEFNCDYTVLSVQTFSKSDTTGVVLILEDATAVAELNLKLERMEQEVQSFKPSIYGETSLQKCIQKLSIIRENLEASDTQVYINEVIKILKQGNLEKADIVYDRKNMHGISSKAISEYIGLDDSEQTRLEQKDRAPSRGYIEMIDNGLLKDLRDINLDPFTIENHMIYIKTMFQDFELFEQIGFSHDVLISFSRAAKEHYSLWDNPFHNFYHGFNVLHATYMLISTTEAQYYFTPHENFALFVAALCHDLEHTGRNNSFEVNRGSNLALIYNDRSVLENHHSAVTFKILQEESCNLIANFDLEMKKSFRKLIIVSILATDMAKHVESITTMSARFKDLAERPLMHADLENAAGLLVHCADLSHPCKEFNNYQKWSKKVCDEFTLQYEEEVKLGLPPTEIMKDLNKPEVYYANEFGFLKFAIKPLWDCINLWLGPRINQYMENLDENINKFQKLKEQHPKIVKL